MLRLSCIYIDPVVVMGVVACWSLAVVVTGRLVRRAASQGAWSRESATATRAPGTLHGLRGMGGGDFVMRGGRG